MTATRHSFTLMLMAFLKDRPNRWLAATEFEQFGRQSWRTRLSEARKRFEAAGDGTIENRVTRSRPGDRYQWTLSEYRYVPPGIETRAENPKGHDINGWGLR